VDGVAEGAVRGARRPAIAAALLTVGALLAGCTADSGTGPAETPPPQAAPPPPPAACLLDTAALAADTGLTWTPDQATATDTRCVYDPQGDAAGTADGPAFVTVEVAAAGEPGAQLDTLAELCEQGSRAPVEAADGGFVCRFQGGNVFAALVSRGKVVTVAASAVPTGATAATLVVAFAKQLGSLGA
jgi:hypothetical protein